MRSVGEVSQQQQQSFASRPGRLRLSPARFRALQPDTRGLGGWLYRALQDGRKYEAMLDKHLQNGDTNPALVMSTQPDLVVAAYSPDIDCVALLRFPASLAVEHGLSVGARLLTVNTYFRAARVAGDLEPGPRNTGMWTNFFPVIAEFVSDDRARLAELKRELGDDEWQRCRDLTDKAMAAMAMEATARLAPTADTAAHPSPRLRDGSPLRSRFPATFIAAPSRAARRIKWCLYALGAIALCFVVGILTRAYVLLLPAAGVLLVLPVLILSYVDWVRESATRNRRGMWIELARAPMRLMGLGLLGVGIGTWIWIGYQALVHHDIGPGGKNLKAGTEFGLPALVLGWWWLTGARGKRPARLRGRRGRKR